MRKMGSTLSTLIILVVVLGMFGIVSASAEEFSFPSNAQNGGIVCPQNWTALSWWWETDPEFSGIANVQMVIVFRNDLGTSLNFPSNPNSTFQLWSVPSVIENMPVVIHEAPSGLVSPGATFTYNMTVSLCDLPSTETRLAFRPKDIVSGTVRPGEASIVSQDFTCFGKCPRAMSVPVLSTLGLILLVLMMVSVALITYAKKH